MDQATVTLASYNIFLIFNKTKPTRTSRMYLMQIEDLKVFSWMTSPDQIDLDRAGKHQLLNKMRIIKIGWPSQKFRDKKHKKYTDEWKTTSVQTNFYIFFAIFVLRSLLVKMSNVVYLSCRFQNVSVTHHWCNWRKSSVHTNRCDGSTTRRSFRSPQRRAWG